VTVSGGTLQFGTSATSNGTIGANITIDGAAAVADVYAGDWTLEAADLVINNGALKIGTEAALTLIAARLNVKETGTVTVDNNSTLKLDSDSSLNIAGKANWRRVRSAQSTV